MADKKVLLEKLFQMKDAVMIETTNMFGAIDSKFSQIAKIDEMIMELAYPEIEVRQEAELRTEEKKLPPLTDYEAEIPEPEYVPEPPEPEKAPATEEKPKGLSRLFRRPRKPATEPVPSPKSDRDALLEEIDRELELIKQSSPKK